MTYPNTPGFVDRDTSVAAAASIEPHVTAMAEKVLNWIKRTPSTCWEVEQALDLSHQTASARVRELSLKKIIEDSGVRRPTGSGRNAIVWRTVKPAAGAPLVLEP